MERRTVRVRVAFLPRSAEIQPFVLRFVFFVLPMIDFEGLGIACGWRGGDFLVGWGWERDKAKTGLFLSVLAHSWIEGLGFAHGWTWLTRPGLQVDTQPVGPELRA